MPGVAQVVAVGVGHSDEGLDGVDVLLLHLGDAGAGRQQREAGQRLHVRVPLQLLSRMGQKRERGQWRQSARHTAGANVAAAMAPVWRRCRLS